MAVPDRSTALRLLDEAGLPDGVVVHSRGVARVAVAAAGLVAEAQIPVDGTLIEAAALLHDIDKASGGQGTNHGIAGARQLEAMGYGELAMPVASHPVTSLLDDDRYPIGWPSVRDRTDSWWGAAFMHSLLVPQAAGFWKLAGLIATALAVSLGAPFWFDLLQRFLNIRAAGPVPAKSSS